MLIFPVSWSGRGSLVPVFVLVAIGVGLTIAFLAREPGAGLGTVGPWPFATGFLLVGALTLPPGLWLNRRSARETAGPWDRSTAIPPAPHRFCGLAVQWWSVLLLVLGGLLLTDEEPKKLPRSPGAASTDMLQKTREGER